MVRIKGPSSNDAKTKVLLVNKVRPFDGNAIIIGLFSLWF